MKQFSIILCFLSLILFVCTHVNLVVQGTTEGLSVWYNNLVPVVLPFLLISGYFLSSLNLEHLNKTQAIFIILVIGLFCGYPVGAIVISRLYQSESIDTRTAYALMPLCNNVSPMFLTGYIYQQYMHQFMPLYIMLGFIYVPQILYAGGYLLSSHLYSYLHRSKPHSTTIHSSDSQPEIAATQECKGHTPQNVRPSVMENSISTITIIGLYVVIFSVISSVIMHYNNTGMISVKMVTAFLEITKGIPDIYELPIHTQIKTALILSLTSFGGISSIFQSVHILKESKLSLSAYILGKLICGTITCMIICML